MSRALCYDLIDKIIGEVGKIKETEKNKRNMDKVINLIKTEGYNLVVYYYKAVAGRTVYDCPYRLWEFTAKYQYDSEDWRSSGEEDDY